nr:HK97 gp10 family phage protein [Limosilactobacillus reuteri]
MDFAASLEEFGRKAEKIAVPDHETKKKMTAAGAEVLVSKLKEVTQEKHYQPGRKTGKVKHLADSIIFENKDMGMWITEILWLGLKGQKIAALIMHVLLDS